MGIRMKRYSTQILKRSFSVFVLIILSSFVFRTASANKTNNEKIKLTGIDAEITSTEPSEIMETETPIEESEMIRKSREPVKNIKKAFKEITLQQLDEAERTADGTTTQYWESDMIFFGRVGEFALYGMNEERVSRGLITRRSDNLFFMDEYYLAPGLYYPELFAEDFDQDGEKEAVIILHRLTGTGYSVEELFLLDETEQENVSDWKLYQFEAKDYLEQLEENLKFEIINDKYQVHLFTADKSQDVSIDLSDELISDDGEITLLEEKIIVGDLVKFNVKEETLKISFTIGLSSERYAIPIYSYYLPLVEAEVSYQNGIFKLENIRFVDNIN